jgi:hypothetical protein
MKEEEEHEFSDSQRTEDGRQRLKLLPEDAMRKPAGGRRIIFTAKSTEAAENAEGCRI